MTTLDLSSTTIATDPSIADLLCKHHLDNVLAVGDAIEILRAPVPLGWGPASIQVALASNDEYPLDPRVVQLLTPHKEKLAGLGWETKYRVVDLEQISSEAPVLRVVFVPSSYEEGTGFHLGLLEALERGDPLVLALRERWASQVLQRGAYAVPGVAVTHATVVTSDDCLVLCQRSPHMRYGPLRWSISFEEQINQKDLAFGNATLSAAAIRGFQEEFACGHSMVPDDVRTLAVFLQYSILNIAFCAYIEAPLSFDEIESSWNSTAKDKWEHVAVVGVPFTLDNVVKLMHSSHHAESEENMGEFHSTSKYRLLLAAIVRFGPDRVINAFKSL